MQTRAPQEGGIINPNPNQFIRPPKPQLMRRKRINEEQPIHPPLKTNNDNNFIEEVVDESYDEYTEEIQLLQDDNYAIHLTQNDYEESLNPKKQMPRNQTNKEALSSVHYIIFVDALQAEMHKKYDLKPRQKEVVADIQPQAKKVGLKLPKDKAKEVIDIPKVDEVLEPVKKEKETKELEELVSSFNFECEFSKIKIPVPLVELAKNPSYHKQIEKMMQGKG
jgi:hypothetical protein